MNGSQSDETGVTRRFEDWVDWVFMHLHPFLFHGSMVLINACGLTDSRGGQEL
jgi:hypothetical protein